MADYEEGAILVAKGIVSLHNAGHTNIEVLLRSLAKKYKAEGINAFTTPPPQHNCKIIPFPNSPGEIK